MSPISQEVTWFVSIVLVEAAVIDGLQLRVPNWLTFHLVVGGDARRLALFLLAGWIGAFANDKNRPCGGCSDSSGLQKLCIVPLAAVQLNPRDSGGRAPQVYRLSCEKSLSYIKQPLSQLFRI